MSITYKLSNKPIHDHAYSPDGSILAITKENVVEIYHVSAKPTLITTLKGHDKTVTSVDISIDGKILTCSQDRNALVWDWDQSKNEYVPTLVLLRINRSANYCRWSPNGTKFAVASSDRIVAICYYEEENNWWVSKHLKKPIKSTITSLDWHPNNVLLATASTDGHVRVFSSFIKGLDEKPEGSVWGTKLPFQTLCGDFTNETGGWVHDVKFSLDGDSIGFVSHDSSLTIVSPQGEGVPPTFVNTFTNHLPFKALSFIGPNTVVVSGHNLNLLVFEGPNWEQSRVVDETVKPVTKVDEDEEISSHDALNMFRQLDLKGRVKEKATNGGADHSNTVESIRIVNGKVSTSGIDGKVVIFSV